MIILPRINYINYSTLPSLLHIPALHYPFLRYYPSVTLLSLSDLLTVPQHTISIVCYLAFCHPFLCHYPSVTLLSLSDLLTVYPNVPSVISIVC